jgi:predicted amidohydrolase
VASAQIAAEPENLAANIGKHVGFIEAAAEQGAELIVFPEMSLTGYECERAAAQAVHADDQRMDDIRTIATERHITVVAGAPVLIDGGLHIGALIFTAGGSTAIYAKQYLHPGEELVFSPGVGHVPMVNVTDERLSCAICFDIEHAEHPMSASRRGTTIYAAGIFYFPTGMDHAHQLLRSYACTFGMAVVMSNFCGRCWDRDAGGRSAIWDPGGAKLAEGDPAGECLLIARKVDGVWSGSSIRGT